MASGKSNFSEEQLVQILHGGTQEGFAQLYDHFSAALYGVVKRIVEDDAQAQDVLQDCFVKIWQKSATYDSSKGRLFTWMLNICRNSAIDYVRSKHSRMSAKIRNLDSIVNSVDKKINLQNSTETIGITQIVDLLHSDQKIIIQKLYFEGYTQEEVSQELEIPLGTVKTRTRSALMKLRETFNKGIK